MIDLYSLSEASSVAIVGPDGVGAVLSNTEIAIIDEHGAPVPNGTAGLDQGAATTPCWTATSTIRRKLVALRFRDGWFIT